MKYKESYKGHKDEHEAAMKAFHHESPSHMHHHKDHSERHHGDSSNPLDFKHVGIAHATGIRKK